MTDLKKTAQQLAAKGRYGDTMLLHVNPLEVAGLASLLPSGRLPINPQTGLPEAFFFLPFLASLFGAAAPAAVAATAAAPALAAGAGAAAGAAGAAGTAAAIGAPAAAMTAGTLMGGASAGPGLMGTLGAVGKAFGSVPGAMAKGIGSFMGGGAGAAGTAAQGVMPAANVMRTAAPAITQAAPTGVQTLTHGYTSGASMMQPGSLGRIAQGAGIDPFRTASIGAGANTPAATAAGAPPIGPGHPITRTGTNLYGRIEPIVPGVNVAPDPITAANSVDMTGHGPIVPGVNVEAHGPIVEGPWGAGPDTATKESWFSMKNLPLMMMGISALSNLFPGKGEKEKKEKDYSKEPYRGGEPSFPSAGFEHGIQGEHSFFKPVGWSGGGIVGFADGGMVDPQMQQPQDLSFPMNGVPGGGIGSLTSQGDAPMQIPESPYPAAQIGAEPEPPAEDVVAPAEADKELIAMTVDVILGRSPVPDPQPILMQFVKEFGEPALEDLVTRVKGLQQGQQQPQMGDGMSDSIPAMIDGQQPAALSEGEFVVPADVVSGLGNGSTQAGAKQLDSLVGGVRQQRTGMAEQPPQINPGYHVGGLVGYNGGGIVGLGG